MAILKCKMCGGDLEVQEGVSVIECDYCGTGQTVPTVKDENLQGLYNRANLLRMKCEFDKAEKIYEKILQVQEQEAEAHWGIVLCEYGIEYVEDPVTFKRVPTCHRASYEAIVANEEYKAALAYADSVQKTLYEAQAKEIDEIQKGILAISQNEEPYDVFICYKETDANGQRTIDSAIANDIYYQLTQEGFKVFYAAITLEEKLGSEYEASIFSALNSAQVMLSIGTKPEYFNAVWVKNEWSRFLKIMKKDRSKMLIPCYRDMDAYELPDEFAHLQAQDMAKIGFINDIVRGIKKVIQKEEAPSNEPTPMSVINNSIAPLVRRSFMFLEDGDWNFAREYCEKILDIEPENPEAYLGKLMVELKVNKREDLRHCAEPFDDSSNYQKAIRFGDETLVEELKNDITYIVERNEEARQNAIYEKGKMRNGKAQLEGDFKEVAEIFASISGYRDAEELQKKAMQDAEYARKRTIYRAALVRTKQYNNLLFNLEEATKEFNSISDFEDAKEKAEACYKRIQQIKQIQNQYKERLADLEQQLKESEVQIKELVARYTQLGIFSGKEKKEIDYKLHEIYRKVDSLKFEKNDLSDREARDIRRLPSI